MIPCNTWVSDRGETLSTTHMVLFHLGVLETPPRSGGPVPFAERLAEVAAPLRGELIGYLERKRATCEAKTVSAMATSRFNRELP